MIPRKLGTANCPTCSMRVMSGMPWQLLLPQVMRPLLWCHWKNPARACWVMRSSKGRSRPWAFGTLSRKTLMACRSSSVSKPFIPLGPGRQFCESHMVEASPPSTRFRMQAYSPSATGSQVGSTGSSSEAPLDTVYGFPGTLSQWYGSVSRRPRIGIVERSWNCVQSGRLHWGASMFHIS